MLPPLIATTFQQRREGGKLVITNFSCSTVRDGPTVCSGRCWSNALKRLSVIAGEMKKWRALVRPCRWEGRLR